MKPSKTENCSIIILLSSNFSCNIHSISISPFSLTLGNVHNAFSPVINTISNSKDFCNLKSDKNSPTIINVPVFEEFVVSIDVQFNTGISISSDV